jgi:hypothetical protein
MNQKTIEKSIWYYTYWIIDSYLADITTEVLVTEKELKVGDKITLKRGERIIRKIIFDDDLHPPIVVTKFKDTANGI